MFPLGEGLDLGSGVRVAVDDAYAIVWDLITEERKHKIERVIGQRTFAASVVLENIYDRGNSSAVMRTAEALGFAQVDLIETGDRFKAANRVTKGADKWLEVTRWLTTADCVKALRAQGKRIVATHLDATAKPIAEIDFSVPTALVLGNEKDGISREMQALADDRVILPMVGFVQSYNISVAAALALYHIYQDRVRRLGRQGDLTARQMKILSLAYAMRTQDSSWDTLRELVARGQLNALRP